VPTRRQSNQLRFEARCLLERSGQGLRQKRATRYIPNGSVAEKEFAKVRLCLSKLLRFLVRERPDSNIPNPGIGVHGGREPRTERFEALIARADQHLPVTEVGLPLYRVSRIDDDALLIGTNVIDPVDEENGRSSRSDLYE